MTKQELGEVFEQVYAEIMELREAGQNEYAHHDGNAFRNFEMVGDLLNLDREEVLMVYALKHVFGIVSHVNGHTSQREDVRGRIKDLIVYMMILYAMQQEDATEDEDIEFSLDFDEPLGGADIALGADDDGREVIVLSLSELGLDGEEVFEAVVNLVDSLVEKNDSGIRLLSDEDIRNILKNSGD